MKLDLGWRAVKRRLEHKLVAYLSFPMYYSFLPIIPRLFTTNTHFSTVWVRSKHSAVILCRESRVRVGAEMDSIILKLYTLEKQKTGDLAYMSGIDIPIGSSRVSGWARTLTKSVDLAL
jgi:hypothetical protein